MVDEGKLNEREKAYRKALEHARKQRDVTPSRTKKYKEIEVNKRVIDIFFKVQNKYSTNV